MFATKNKSSIYQYELNGGVAQLVEQFPFKEWVDGSSPSGLTINILGILKIIKFNKNLTLI